MQNGCTWPCGSEKSIPEEGMQVQDTECLIGTKSGEPEARLKDFERCDGAFLRVEQNRYGKRIHFNKIAGAMLSGYDRADIWVKKGRLYIYPSRDGAYAVTRTTKNDHVQICCSDVIDELVSRNEVYDVEKRDNHIIARVAC